MSLLDYIRGNRKGKNANRLEREAMADPFLAEALEGFDSVNDDHIARIATIQKQLSYRKVEKSKHRSIWTSAAAVAVAVITVVGISHFASDKSDSGLHAQASSLTPISIYIPEAIYTENIAIIATKNTELTKDVSIKFSQNYKAELQMDIEYEALEEELKAIENGGISASSTTIPSPEKNLEPIQVYMPTGINTSQKRYNQSPEPLIGFKEYEKYLRREIQRPDVWPCEGKKGKVLVEFSIDEEGNPYNIVVEYGFCGASDDEAIRLIEKGPRWTPSNIRARVKVEF